MKTKILLTALLIGCSVFTWGQSRETTRSSNTATSNERREGLEKLTGTVARVDRQSDKKKELREHRFKKASGTLMIEADAVSLEGYKGDEVIVSMMVEAKEEDPRAAGLQGLFNAGYQDNTELGLNITEEGNTTRIRSVRLLSKDTIHIKVPDHLHVVFKEISAFWGGGNVSFKNMQGELEISSNMGNVLLDNVTGPVTVKSASGNIEAVFRSPVKGPVSLVTSIGFVDIALPLGTKANLDMRATMGELFADKAFNIEVVTEDVTGSDSNKEEQEDQRKTELFGFTRAGTSVFDRFGNLAFPGFGTRIHGTINGGGEHIILRTAQGKIYLRLPQN